MKHTIVPAQITTVEDKVAANLTMNQLLILASPLFFDIIIYLALPPLVALDPYKIILFIVISPLLSILAIKYKGETIFNWTIALLRYQLRPHIFVYDKNSSYCRDESISKTSLPKAQVEVVKTKAAVAIKQLSPDEIIRATGLLNSVGYSLSFTRSKKADINVQIIQAK